MSIVEDAVRKAADTGRNPYEGSHTTRLRSRRANAPVYDPGQVRQFRSAALSPKALERNRILPQVADQAALRAFKILRTRVLRRMEANKWQSLAVTSIVPGEGKTLTATNLAVALAQDVNTWVFLVDLDLQRPQVAASLGMSFDRGLGDYLVGEAGIDEIVYNPGMSRLAVIPNARSFQQSSEFLTSPRMGELLNTLEQEIPRRTIVFDMPPMLASDDVLAFAPQVDGVLLVVSEGMTGRAALEGANEILAEMNLVGVVLNRSTERIEDAYYTR